MENLKRLQNLCNAINSRYQRGLNDDDAVSKMFKFANTIKDAQVIIGYDDYQALSVEEVKELEKTGTKEENEMFSFYRNFRTYRTKKISKCLINA